MRCIYSLCPFYYFGFNAILNIRTGLFDVKTDFILVNPAVFINPSLSLARRLIEFFRSATIYSIFILLLHFLFSIRADVNALNSADFAFNFSLLFPEPLHQNSHISCRRKTTRYIIRAFRPTKSLPAQTFLVVTRSQSLL